LELHVLTKHALLDDLRPPLINRGLLVELLAAPVGGEHPVDEGLADLDLRRELGELELRVLEGGDGLPERVPLAHVGDRVGERSAAGGERGDRDRDALLLELLHEHLEALALAAEQVPDRHAAVLEEELARVLRVEAELVELAAADEARRIGRDQEEA